MNAMLRFVLLLMLFHQTTCVCRESFMTICDSVEDVFLDKPQDRSWTHLLIQSDKPKELQGLHMNRLYNALYFSNHKLRVLIIVGQFISIHNRLAGNCLWYLEYVSFYGNKITVLRPNTIPVTPNVRRMSLLNNSIEVLESRAFLHQPTAEFVDLSDNLIEELRKDVFLGSNTTKLFIKNNKINFIEGGSLPRYLEVFNVRNNKLTLLEDEAIGNLVNLREIYLDQNQITQMPNFRDLIQLQVVSVSHNNIKSVSGNMFEKLVNLRMVDLSSNKISSLYGYLRPFAQLEHPWKVSLAYNLLQEIEDSDLGNLTYANGTVYLHGNPWWCLSWPNIENLLNNKTLPYQKCDEAEIPYCIADSLQHDENERILVTRQYFNTAREHQERLSHCDLHAAIEKLPLDKISCGYPNLDL